MSDEPPKSATRRALEAVLLYTGLIIDPPKPEPLFPNLGPAPRLPSERNTP